MRVPSVRFTVRRMMVAVAVIAAVLVGATRAVNRPYPILADASPITSDVFERIEALRESVYQSADYLEGIHAFQQKRPPSFTGR